MNTILKVNSRGTVTLPKALRKVLGLGKDGGILMYSLRDGDVVIQPAQTYPYRIWTDEEIAMFKEEEEALGPSIDALYEKLGLVYDEKTGTIHEKGTPYMSKKKGKKKA